MQINFSYDEKKMEQGIAAWSRSEPELYFRFLKNGDIRKLLEVSKNFDEADFETRIKALPDCFSKELDLTPFYRFTDSMLPIDFLIREGKRITPIKAHTEFNGHKITVVFDGFVKFLCDGKQVESSFLQRCFSHPSADQLLRAEMEVSRQYIAQIDFDTFPEICFCTIQIFGRKTSEATFFSLNGNFWIRAEHRLTILKRQNGTAHAISDIFPEFNGDYCRSFEFDSNNGLTWILPKKEDKPC